MIAYSSQLPVPLNGISDLGKEGAFANYEHTKVLASYEHTKSGYCAINDDFCSFQS